MKLTLTGCGCGRDSLTADAQKAIRGAELLIGPARLLEELAEGKLSCAAATPNAMLEAALSSGKENICILLSGDSGFYSSARLLLRRLPEEERAGVRLLPGIASVQAFASRLKEPWQGWRLCSAHGVECDPVWEVCQGSPVFFLTGGKNPPGQLCAWLADAGLGLLQVRIGENFGLAEERILSGTAGEFAGEGFAPLSVLLAAPAPGRERRTPGIPDARFLREKGIPMTKQEVRATALAKLSIRPDETCWDIGTGTGSVAIELALQARRIYGIEPDSEALSLAEKNRRAFGAWNLRLIPGRAPEALAGLPKPDAVFIGGSGGEMKAILRTIAEISPEARICISAVTVENLSAALQTLRGLGYAPAVTQLSVSRGKTAGDLTLMQAQNPVWLITGERA